MFESFILNHLHSVLNDFTGLAMADRIVWMLNVSNEIAIIASPVAANIHQLIEVR